MKNLARIMSDYRKNISFNFFSKYIGSTKQFLREKSGASTVEYMFMASSIFVIATGVAIAIDGKIVEYTAIFR